jgi:hypothetical protein
MSYKQLNEFLFLSDAAISYKNPSLVIELGLRRDGNLTLTISHT